jgi:hypothetical protein
VPDFCYISLASTLSTNVMHGCTFTMQLQGISAAFSIGLIDLICEIQKFIASRDRA